jgi:endogenous inhibitor of DNA gyrase (YacG/DUF329 family)
MKMAKIKCPKCGADVEEIDCLDFEITDDDVILKKWGMCTKCKAEIEWNEYVPNNPIVRITSIE